MFDRMILLAIFLVTASTASNSPHVFSPLSFGADPSGQRDSTNALQLTISLALNATKTRSCGNISDPSCGGAVVDLQYGAYLISRSLNITGNGGNWRVFCGSLLAAPTR